MSRENAMQIGNTPLPQEMKELSDDELREVFVKLGERAESREFGAGLLETYAKEVRRRKNEQVRRSLPNSQEND